MGSIDILPLASSFFQLLLIAPSFVAVRQQMLFLLPVLLGVMSATSALEEWHHREPLEAEYYGQEGEAKPWKVPKISSIETKVFRELVSQGKPVIVTDATRDWPMHGWTCSDFQRRFASGKMRMEYNAKANPNDANTASFGDGQWMNAEAPSGAKDSAAPQLAPFYWGIGIRLGEAPWGPGFAGVGQKPDQSAVFHGRHEPLRDAADPGVLVQQARRRRKSSHGFPL